MARDYSKQKESHVTMVPRNDRGDYVRVCRLEGNGLPAVDIRNYYTSDNDGNRYPTTKGVRLHAEMLVETVVAILHACTDEELDEVWGKLDNLEEDE